MNGGLILRSYSLILCLALSSASAAEKPACAVLNFDAKAGIAKEEAELLSERFALEFGKLGKFQLIGRSKMKDVLEQQKFNRSDQCSATECAIEAGRLLQAEWMVYGSLGKVGNTWTVNAALVSVETGAIAAQAGVDVEGQVDELLKQGMRNAARQLAGLPGLGGESAGEAPAPPVAPAAAPRGRPAGNQAWVSSLTRMEFVWIPALKLWAGKYEVTNGEYRKFKANHNSGEFQGHSLNGDRQPVVMVNFEDAKAFAEWLTARERQAGRLPEGYRFRLPAEDEWLIFAQCGDGREYPWGNNWLPKSGQAGNYADAAATGAFSGWKMIDGYSDGHAVSCDVEQSWANPWGIYGVGGNVLEVTAKGKDGASFGAWRGASYYNNLRVTLRCSYRHDPDVSVRGDGLGFRLVLAPP